MHFASHHLPQNARYMVYLSCYLKVYLTAARRLPHFSRALPQRRTSRDGRRRLC